MAELTPTEQRDEDMGVIDDLLAVEDGLSSSAVEFVESLSRWLDDHDTLTPKQRKRALEIHGEHC